MKKAFSNHSFQEALLFTAAAVALAVYSLIKHYTGLRVEWKLSPYLFPLLVSVLLAIPGFALLAQARRELGAGEEKGATGPHFSVRNFALTLALAAAYYCSLKRIAFVLSTAVLLAAMQTVLGERRAHIIALVSAAVSGALWLLFAVCLRVDLP